MSQNLPVNSFVWTEDTSQFKEDFLKNYDEGNKEGYFLEVEVQYLENLREFYHGLPFLPEKIKIEKVEKFVTNLHDKSEYVIHIKTLKQALNQRLVLKNLPRVSKINQKAWLGRYNDMKANLRRRVENNFQEYFFQLMNNSVFGKTIENVRKHKNIKLITAESRKII